MGLCPWTALLLRMRRPPTRLITAPRHSHRMSCCCTGRRAHRGIEAQGTRPRPRPSSETPDRSMPIPMATRHRLLSL